MSDDYARGQRDGLRLALATPAAEEALLGTSPSWRTNATREVRHKALQVAQKRVQKVLKRRRQRTRPRSTSSCGSPRKARSLDRTLHRDAKSLRRVAEMAPGA
jgi:hypothetical protein